MGLEEFSDDTTHAGEYWLSSNGSNVRLYGILVRELQTSKPALATPMTTVKPINKPNVYVMPQAAFHVQSDSWCSVM